MTGERPADRVPQGLIENRQTGTLHRRSASRLHERAILMLLEKRGAGEPVVIGISKGWSERAMDSGPTWFYLYFFAKKLPQGVLGALAARFLAVAG